MPIFPKLRVQATSRKMTDTFLGYNHNLKIADGEFYDTTNMTTEFYPLLANRRKRSWVSVAKYHFGMLGGDKLACVRTVPVQGDTVPDIWLFYDGEPVLKLASQPIEPSAYVQRELVHFGSYICVFPDKMYYNTADGTNGSMESHYTQSSYYPIAFQPCDINGELLNPTPVVSETPPQNPQGGDLWFGQRTMYKYNAATGQWDKVKTYMRIIFDNNGGTITQTITTDFKVNDVVTFGGFVPGIGIPILNGDHVIEALGDATVTIQSDTPVTVTGQYIVIEGYVDDLYGRIMYNAHFGKSLPDMDYVCEAQNRLWGCKYGTVDGETVNELYACALGDFTNWRKYTGISTDSWAASVGSPGFFTGAVNYMGYPTFFKEDRVYRIAVSAKGAHQVTETMMNGVQDGSARSLTVMDNVLFYKAIDGVYAYQGGFPTKISDALGDVSYDKACGGCIGHRLYMSMRDKSLKRNVFVYDSDRKLWMREDDIPILQFARSGSKLYGIEDGRESTIHVMYDEDYSVGTEITFPWSCETGIMYYEYPDHKYLSRYNIRMSMAKGAYMDIFFEYDSSGRWERAGKVRFSGTDTVTIPVRPRRCDHMRMKLSGEGDVRIYSIARILEVGSDV